MDEVTLREANPEDCPEVLRMIQALANYENRGSSVTARVEDIRNLLFGERPMAEATLAELDGEAIGFALYFHTISSFAGKPGLYVEDLFVAKEHRSKGVGRKLLIHLARLALERKCLRLEWSVLSWNQRAIEFYVSLGAHHLDAWHHYSLSGEALDRLATN